MSKFIVNLTIQGTIETIRLEDEKTSDVNTSEDFVKSLRLHRHTKGLTIHQLSHLSGVSPSHIGRIEKNERAPSYKIAIKLRKALAGETND